MAVTTETSRVSYAGNGLSVAFAVPFKFEQNGDLLVIVRNEAGAAESVKTLGTHYSVTGAGAATGGTLTMVLAPAVGETLYVILDPDLLQAFDLSGGSSFPAESFETALDRGVHQQQRTREIAERTPHLADTDTDGAAAYDAKLNRIKNLADPVVGTDAATKAYVLSQTIVSAMPPAGSIGNAEADAADPFGLDKVKGLTAAEQQVETNPLPLADSASQLVQWQKAQNQLLGILNWLDAGVRTHAYDTIPVSNLPAVVAAQIAAAVTAGSEWINGSLMVSQRFPSESATGTIATGVDAYICDEVFILPTGGTLTWNRVTAGLHSTAKSPIGLELVGAAGITNVLIGQRIGRRRARKLGALLANKNVTIGVKVRHSGTTGSITPNLIVRTTSHTGDEALTKFAAGSMTTRLTQAFPGALTAGLEVAFTHTFDLGAMVDSQNGFEVSVDLLAMNAATIKFTVTDFWLAVGDLSASLLADDFDAELDKCLVGFDKTADYSVSLATLQAGTAGFAGALVGHGKDGANQSGMHWSHARPMRFAGSLVTYNPGAAANTPRNYLGDNGTIITSNPGEKVANVRYDTGGTDAVAWYLHATQDASFYD